MQCQHLRVRSRLAEKIAHYERVCGLLAESVKPGGEARLRACLPAEQIKEVLGQRGGIASRWGDVKRRLDRAATTGSKLEAGQRLRSMS